MLWYLKQEDWNLGVEKQGNAYSYYYARSRCLNDSFFTPTLLGIPSSDGASSLSQHNDLDLHLNGHKSLQYIICWVGNHAAHDSMFQNIKLCNYAIAVW